MGVTNYFEQARRGCLSILKKCKNNLRGYVVYNKNQTKLFEGVTDTDMVEFQNQWLKLDALEREIKYFKTGR